MAMTASNEQFTTSLPPNTGIGSIERDLQLVLDGASKDTAFTAVAVETTITTAPSATTGRSGIRSCSNAPMLRFKFGLRNAGGTDGVGGNFKIVLYHRAPAVVDGADACPLIPEVVATGTMTAGTLIYSDDIGSATATVGDMWADTIVCTTKSLGVYAHSPVDNTPACLMVDTRGACAYEVFVYIAAANTKIDVWCQRAGVMPPFDVASLVDGTAQPAGQSVYDLLGAFTGSSTGTAADDNVKALGDLIHSDAHLLAAGSSFWVKKVLVSSAILTTGVDVTAAASGELAIEDVVCKTDDPGLATGTNFVLCTNNAKGDDAVATAFFVTTVASLGALKTVDLSNATVSKKHTVLETTKKIVAKSTVAACDGAGTVDVYIKFSRMSAAGIIAAA